MSHSNRPTRWILLLGVWMAASSAGAQATPLQACLDTTGMALVGGHSGASAATAVSWLFGGPGGGTVRCGELEPLLGSAEIGALGNYGAIQYGASTGAAIVSTALASPASDSRGNAFFAGNLIFKFHVIPDDPFSTDPVQVDFTTRHRFGNAQVETSGTRGSASNNFRAAYGVKTNPIPISSGAGSQWDNGDIPPIEHGYYDITETVSVPVNLNRYFVAELRHSSVTTGYLSPPSSGIAGMLSLWSFEATTDDPATIVFEIETLLGLDPPQLDELPEPSLGASLGPLMLFLGALATRRRRPGGQLSGRSTDDEN